MVKKNGLTSFAIGNDPAVMLSAGKWIYELHGKSLTKLKKSDSYPGNIYQSCGMIMGEAFNDSVNLVNGAKVEIAGLKRPRCSADRSKVVGVNSRGDLVTERGRIIVEARLFYPGAYDISPSGRWIGMLVGRDDNLCVIDTTDWSRNCYNKTAEGYELPFVGLGGVSVNDAGEVLIVAYYSDPGRGCWYTDTWASHKKFPGSSGDACTGVAIASSTVVPHVIIPLGFRPTWIDEKELEAQFRSFAGKKGKP